MNGCGLHFQSIASSLFEEMKARSTFELGKWDQQYTDHASLADFAIVLDPEVYRQLSAWAEAMAGELFRAEREILGCPELLDRLALPHALKKAVRRFRHAGAATRLCRFDFHPTEDGWRISEVNSDVPGGLIESDGLPPLLGDEFSSCDLLPSTTEAYLDALLAGGIHPHPLALVHATAYTDDRQVMLYLQRALEARGQQAILLSPDNLRWLPDAVQAETEWYKGPISQVLRFYPAEWMANLSGRCRWQHSAGISGAWMSNPLHALISQSKAFPLVWDDLREPMATWRRLLPETRPFRHRMLLKREQWIFKPALGRVGEGIFFSGVSSRRSGRDSLLACTLFPRHWVAQRPFRARSYAIDGKAHWPCLGLYTVNERAVGIYARTARKPLVDGSARDTPVFLSGPEIVHGQNSYETAGAL